jgi:hypothetical protein
MRPQGVDHLGPLTHSAGASAQSFHDRSSAAFSPFSRPLRYRVARRVEYDGRTENLGFEIDDETVTSVNSNYNLTD